MSVFFEGKCVKTSVVNFIHLFSKLKHYSSFISI